jgi:endonuclease III
MERTNRADESPLMNKRERAQFIQQHLQRLYPDTPIPLQHVDPYTLLVAVVLSAQTTDKKVNQVTPELFALADTPAAMARLPVETIQAVIQPLGLAPQKAKAISELSRQLLERFDGRVPGELRGSGIAARRRAQDGQRRDGSGLRPSRFSRRYPHPPPGPTLGTDLGPQCRADRTRLEAVVPQEAWNRLHLQIIFYGRQHCTARGCDGTVCEICRTCFPKRKKPVVQLICRPSSTTSTASTLPQVFE